MLSKVPPYLGAIRLDMVPDLKRDRVHHVAVPIGIDLLSKVEIGEIASASIETRTSQSRSRVGCGRLLSMRFIPPHPALDCPATTRIPPGLDVRMKRFGLVQVLDVAGQVIGSQQSHGHPALVIVIAGKPAALVLTKVKTLNQTIILLATGPLHAIH